MQNHDSKYIYSFMISFLERREIIHKYITLNT
jgi:hypothetical protein